MKRIPKWIRRVVALVTLLAAVLGLWAFWWEPSDLRVVEECVAVPWRKGESLRAATISDLHAGSPFNGIARVRSMVDRANAANPDIVFILGDLVIQGVVGGSFVTPEDIASELQRLRAPMGVFAVLGNHDVWLDAARVRNALQNAGIPVVEDRAVRISAGPRSVWVAGVSDYWTQAHDIKAALSAINDDSPVILITHNPDIFPDVPQRVNVTLAGHTHGGQVLLPIAGRPVVPSKFGQRFAAGHIVENSRHLYVATGIGTSILPVRFRVPPTVPILTLTDKCPPQAE